jgi:ABC-type dipeptide/oligopeptide/nickel transport system permease subunit
MTLPTASQPKPSLFQRMWKGISIVSESKVAIVGLALVLFWVIVSIVSLFWTPYAENSSLFVQNLPPNAVNWLGTDHMGRDIVSRLMVGTQVVLLKTRLPADMTLGSVVRLVGFIALVVTFFSYLVVLARMFRNAGRLWGFLGIIPLVSYVWGWLNVRRQKLTNTMILWSLGILLTVILFLVAGRLDAQPLPRISLPIGVAIWGVLGSLALGALLGLNAGYRGGWWDQAIMQVLDALIAFPRIVLYLVVIAALGQNDLVVIVAITVTGAPGVARLARSLTMDIKTRDYIRAAETRGESVWYIMFRETLPNARGPLLVDAMLRVGYAIFAIGTLGFLGIGLPPPDPDWGNMVNEARRNIFANPLAVVWPAMAIATLVIGLNLFADGLSEEMGRYQK